MVKINPFLHVLLPAVHAVIFLSSLAVSVEPTNALFGRQESCARAYAQKTVNGTLLSCWYLCKGLPVRFDFEENGHACFMDSWFIGECDNSKCVNITATTVASSALRNSRTKKSIRRNQGQVSASPGTSKQKCTRAAKRIEAVRRSCRYRCLGQPMRLEMEPDGTPCKPAPRRRGYCYKGRCRMKYPETKTTYGPATSTTGQDPLSLPLSCSKKKRKRRPDGAVTACFFRCARGKSRFIVMEEQFTPCVDSRGLRGVCIGKVCRMPPSATTPSSPSGRTGMAQKPQRTSTPVLFSRETYAADNRQLPSSNLSVAINGITTVHIMNHFTSSCSRVLRAGCRDRTGWCSDTAASLRPVKPETTTATYISAAVKIPVQTSRNPGSHILIHGTEENISFEGLGSVSNSERGANSKKNTPRIICVYADASTKASVVNATSAQSALQHQLKTTSSAPNFNSTWLKGSNESLKYVTATKPTAMQSAIKWDIQKVQVTEETADLGSRELSVENFPWSTASKENFTTSTVDVSSLAAPSIYFVSSNATRSLRPVDTRTTSVYMEQIVTKGSDEDRNSKRTTKLVSIKTTPTYQEFNKGDTHKFLSSESTKPVNAKNSKENNTYLTARPTTTFTTEEANETSPRHYEHSDPASSFLVPKRLIMASTNVFLGAVSTLDHESESEYQNVSPLADGATIHKISNAPMESTSRMEIFTVSPEGTTKAARHEPVLNGTNSPITYAFVTPSVQTAPKHENELAYSPLFFSSREPFIIFTDFFQKFATQLLTRKTTPVAQNGARIFATGSAIRKMFGRPQRPLTNFPFEL